MNIYVCTYIYIYIYIYVYIGLDALLCRKLDALAQGVQLAAVRPYLTSCIY